MLKIIHPKKSFTNAMLQNYKKVNKNYREETIAHTIFQKVGTPNSKKCVSYLSLFKSHCKRMVLIFYESQGLK